VLVGGYGGWLSFGPYAHLHDGFVTRADIWETFDGYNWNMLSATGQFGVIDDMIYMFINICVYVCVYTCISISI